MAFNWFISLWKVMPSATLAVNLSACAEFCRPTVAKQTRNHNLVPKPTRLFFLPFTNFQHAHCRITIFTHCPMKRVHENVETLRKPWIKRAVTETEGIESLLPWRWWWSLGEGGDRKASNIRSVRWRCWFIDPRKGNISYGGAGIASRRIIQFHTGVVLVG